MLLTWAEHYLKSLDALYKTILSIDHEEDKLIINHKDKKETIIANTALENIQKEQLEQNLSIITLNNRKNVDTLYKNWSDYSAVESFKIYFVNPVKVEKWVITPFVHAKICDEASLKIGLKTLFESVEPITEEILQKKAAV